MADEEPSPSERQSAHGASHGQSGGYPPPGIDADDENPLHDPSEAGAAKYNNGNTTGYPVSSGTPGVAEHDGSANDAGKTPTVDRDR